MVFQAYADESGLNDGTSRNLAIAALISTAERWAQFSDEWAACLTQPPAIDYFKMKEAAGLSGQFHRRTKEERDAKLLALSRIIDRHVMLVGFTGINLEAHKKTLELPGEPYGRDPYWLPFHTIIWDVTKHLWSGGLREKFEFIFDEQLIFGERAKAWYAAIRHVSRMDNPGAYEILPVEPVFRSDRDALPLQAADLFAWMYRYSGDNPGKPRPFEWILKEVTHVRQIVDTNTYDAAGLEKVMAASEAMKARQWTELEIETGNRFQEDSPPSKKRKKPREKK